MKQIRQGVFETNSSSSHSISIRKLNEYYTQNELEDSVHIYNGILSLWDHDLDFGRSPFEPLLSFFDKVRYAIASFDSDEKNRHEIEDILFEKIPELKKIEYPVEQNWKTDKEETYYGSVDHQSIGVLESMLARHNVTLREFLLNKRYVVFIDGDEYNIKEKLFDSGLININDFEEVDA